MWLKKSLILILVSTLSWPAYALRVGGVLGLGDTKMSNEATETEGPMTQSWTVERLFHSRLAFGVEHLRSLEGSFTTSASFTGLLGRYYLNSSPTKVMSVEAQSYENIISKDLGIFIGVGLGFAQSSRLPNDVGLSSNVAGLYVSPRVGVEYQLTKHIGFRGEALYARSILGKGTLQMISFGGGLYYIF